MTVRNDFVPGEFCWIDLTAHDLEQAAAWYADQFGWTLQLQETPGGGPPNRKLLKNKKIFKPKLLFI